MRYLAENAGKPGIVYCSTRKTVDELCEKLILGGVSATRYHAGMADGERLRNQDDFQYDRADVMVATNAFGMGIDKSNVSFVIHYNMPKDVESYYQEAGRAGRDGSPADCILYYSGQDVHANRFLIEKSVEENGELTPQQRALIMERDLDRLRYMTFYATTDDCFRAYILKYFGEHGAPFCGHCGNCDTEFEEIDVRDEARAALSCVYLLAERRLAFGKSLITQILRGSDNERIRAYRLNRMKTWGRLKSLPAHRVSKLLDYLIAEGYLETMGDKYPVLLIAADAKERMDAGESLLMKLPKAKPVAKAEVRRGKGAGAGALRGAGSGAGRAVSNHEEATDMELFERLRALRRRLADEAGIPAFVVFPDTTLRDMCRLLPRSQDEFLQVSGVGETKCERYGAAFLSEINRDVL
jgi:ATP-dependent DNA helicase RecQ